jgi:hypothetical protein
MEVAFTGGLPGVVNITVTLISTMQTCNCSLLDLWTEEPDPSLID